jgi:hypothetical protein
LSYLVDFTEYVLDGFWGYLFVPVWEGVFGSNTVAANNSSRHNSRVSEEHEFLE